MAEAKCVNLSYKEWRLFGCVWNYEDFTALLDAMLKENKIILGGDILTRSGGALCSTGCGWYYEGDDALSSNIEAQSYLAGLSDWARRENLYVTFSLKKGM